MLPFFSITVSLRQIIKIRLLLNANPSLLRSLTRESLSGKYFATCRRRYKDSPEARSHNFTYVFSRVRRDATPQEGIHTSHDARTRWFTSLLCRARLASLTVGSINGRRFINPLRHAGTTGPRTILTRNPLLAPLPPREESRYTCKAGALERN